MNIHIEDYDYKQFVSVIKENTGIEFPSENNILKENQTFDYISFGLENFPDNIDLTEDSNFDFNENKIFHAGSINFLGEKQEELQKNQASHKEKVFEKI